MILLCTNPACVSAFQDERYGRNMRVQNIRLASEGKQFKGYRCTVCSATNDGPAPTRTEVPAMTKKVK